MPLRSTLHTDKLLTQVSVNYKNAAYIAMEMFPIIGVKKQSDQYRVYTRDFRIPETRRANRAMAREHQLYVTTSSYLLENHGIKEYVSDDDQDNFDGGDLKADTVEALTEVIHRRIEYDMGQLFLTTTSWSLSVSLAATGAWSSNSAGSNPIPVVDTAATTVLGNSGVTPNYMVLRRDGFIVAKNHVSILDRVKYTSAEMDEKIMARLFSVDKLLISETRYNSAAEGLTEVITDIWPNTAFLGYRPSSIGPKKMCTGYVFMKDGGMKVRRWRDEEREAEAIEVDAKYALKIAASLTGYLISDIT